MKTLCCKLRNRAGVLMAVGREVGRDKRHGSCEAHRQSTGLLLLACLSSKLPEASRELQAGQDMRLLCHKEGVLGMCVLQRMLAAFSH